MSAIYLDPPKGGHKFPGPVILSHILVTSANIWISDDAVWNVVDVDQENNGLHW